VKMPGKRGDTVQIRANGVVRVVAELEIVAHPLA
jgi:hypothetical protein